MVARIVMGKRIAGVVYYNEDKVVQGQASLIMVSGFATELPALTLNMKINRFQYLTMLNAATKTNALHISLNFHKKDRLNSVSLSGIAREYMEGIGFGDQPYLVYQHLDAHHPHLHIVSTNIQRDGSRIDVHGIGYRLSEPVRKTIEQKYRLIVAEGREEKQQIEKIRFPKQVLYGQRASKKALSRLIRAVRDQYLYGNLTEFNAILNTFNVIAMPGAAGSRMEQNKGLLYAIIDERGQVVGVPIKASALSGKPILRSLEKNFAMKQELKNKLKPGLKAKIDQVLINGTSSMYVFERALSASNICLVIARSKDGGVFGLSYIDQQSRAIFKGSELGKNYSAQGISNRLSLDKRQEGIELNVARKESGQNDNNQQSNKNISKEQNSLMPDVGFLLEPGQGHATVTISRKKKKRSIERGQQV